MAVSDFPFELIWQRKSFYTDRQRRYERFRNWLMIWQQYPAGIIFAPTLSFFERTIPAGFIKQKLELSELNALLAEQRKDFIELVYVYVALPVFKKGWPLRFRYINCSCVFVSKALFIVVSDRTRFRWRVAQSQTKIRFSFPLAFFFSPHSEICCCSIKIQSKVRFHHNLGQFLHKKLDFVK